MRIYKPTNYDSEPCDFIIHVEPKPEITKGQIVLYAMCHRDYKYANYWSNNWRKTHGYPLKRKQVNIKPVLYLKPTIHEQQKVGTTMSKFEYIQNELLTLPNKGDLSDGYHTYNELYDHRMVLFSIICNQNKNISWKSKLHHDGTMFDYYFIAGINTPEGQFTYHYRMDYWDNFEVPELEKAPEYDSHTPDDITRLYSIL